MPDSGYFIKLRQFLTGSHRGSRNMSRRVKRQRRASRSESAFHLECLEPRVLLAADLAGAIQAAQVVEPPSTEPTPAAVILADEETCLSGPAAPSLSYGNLPLSFEANQGQADSQIEYLARGDGYSLSLIDNGAVLNLQQDGSAAAVVSMELVGANLDSMITGEQLLPGVANYFIGNDPSQWRTGIPTYEQVQYDEIYTGIDLIYYGNQGQLEYDFVVAPGADPGTIQLRFTGASQLSLNDQGDLVLHVGDEQLTVQKPALYQLVDGVRQEISGNFVLDESGTVGFQVGTYDRNQSLVIDPVLIYSTYFGGSGQDRASGLTVDGSGSAYIAGITSSNNLPSTQGRRGDRFDTDVFVTRLNSAGTAVLYTTYLGGNNSEIKDVTFPGGLLAVDEEGNAYVGGTTLSSDFPITAGAYDTTYNGAEDGIITKLDRGGTIVYSTYLGSNGADSDKINGIAVHAGQIYVTGGIASDSSTIDFPTTPGAFQRTSVPGVNNPVDAFVSKLKPEGNGPSDLVYSTLLSGSLGDVGSGIAVDAQGHAYVTGQTSFHVDSFGRFEGGIPTGVITEQGFVPLRGTFQDGPGGGSDGFVAKLNPSGTGLIYSRYLGGNTTDLPLAIAIDDSGHAYVTGWTISTTFPVTAGAFQTTPGSERSKGFVTKLDPTGANQVYSTYVRGVESLNDIAVNSQGNIVVTGNTLSSSFVTTPDALQPGRSPESIPAGDAAIAILNPAGSGLTYASYLGGNGADNGTGIAWDAAGNIYVTGYTDSTNFPTTSGAFPQSFHTDAFVTKIGFVQPNQAPVANPDSYNVNEDTTLTVPARGVLANDTDVDNNPLTAALVTAPVSGTLALNADGSFTYTPNSNFNGSDSFTYKANDGNADSNVATVSISVTSVNDPPTAVNDTGTVAEDSGATAISVLQNDSVAPDSGETLTIVSVTQGSNGVVTITGNGTGLTYAPNANFFGSDSFTYTISDGNGGQATASVNMTITSVNDAPIANAGPDQTVLGGTLVTLDGTASADPEGQTLSFAWTLLTKPTGSAAVILNPTVSKPTFTPDIVGAYTVQLVVTDSQSLSSTPDTVQIIANPLTVQIDIRPGEFPNNINLGSGGVVQVAILSSNTLNAPRDVDPLSVTLASASVRLRGNGTPTTTVRDVNGDGRDDLIVQINTEALQLTNTDTQATLDGKTFGGIPIRGTDSIRVVQ